MDEQSLEPQHGDLDVEALLRELDAADLVAPTPPDDLWEGIERRLTEPDATDPDAAHPGATVVDLGSRRRSWSAVLGIAAAMLLAVAGIAVVIGRSGGDTVVATADLVHDRDFDPLGTSATAEASLIATASGYTIVLADAELPDPADLDLELWLLEVDDAGTVLDVAPVARVDGPGSFAVPATVDVTTHRVVDISVEPRDGDEHHSGRSILRGTLTDA